MQRILPEMTPEMAGAAVAFMTDHVGMPRHEVERAVSMHGPDRRDSNMAALLAAQSLLLGAYTPSSAALWMRTVDPALGGRTPAEAFADGDVAALLGAARDRVS